MNGLKNEIRLWYCDICDKTIINKSKSRQINSKTHKHKQKHGIVVKAYEFLNEIFLK